MKKIVFFVLYIFFVFVCLNKGTAQSVSHLPATAQNLYFVENKGQIKDQHANPRNDIQYAIQAPGITVYIGNGQLHYQFSKKISCGDEQGTFPGVPVYPMNNPTGNAYLPLSIPEIANNSSSDIETYRMDVELIGANKHAKVISGEQQAYYENYYLPGHLNATTAHTYNKIIYKDVYPGIDWMILIRDGKLEHEFVVGPRADASQIRLKYNGQTSLSINDDHSITAMTPMGIIKEHAPKCYRPDGSITPSSYKLRGNTLSYDVEVSGALVIDPQLEWATYYGAVSSTTQLYDVACDDSGHVYAVGLTYGGPTGSISTVGSYHDTLSGVGTTDAFLVKFDSTGHRIWGTYYGGPSNDWATAVGCDNNGHVYIGGSTNSLTGIATPGAQIPNFIGNELWVGFLGKFNAAGYRQWCTYVGGCFGVTYDLEVASIWCDRLGHILISGSTDDTANVTTPGSFKPKKYYGADTIDDFVIQYDTNGVELWGTYYGGRGNEYVGGMCLDKYNNVYLCGYTASDTGTGRAPAGTGISSSGSWQPLFGGVTDAFLVKFNNSGNRLWGTYYGGPSNESTGGVICDTSGNIYLLGNTGSDTAISTPGSYQHLRGGSDDAFVAKFEPQTGMRLWGTYYGGPGTETLDLSPKIAVDNSNNVYIAGQTTSTTGIATACATQSAYGGGTYDGFFAQFDSSGTHCWGTYYGGTGADNATACVFDGYKSIYICGWTNSPNNIATPGSFLDTGGGATFYYQGFLAKFNSTITSGSIAGLDTVCIDSIISLTGSIPGGTWSSTDTTVASVSSGGVVRGKVAGVDTIKYTTFACGVSLKKVYVTNKCRTGIDNISLLPQEISIHPNPASDIINIIAQIPLSDGMARITITNLDGKVMISDVAEIKNGAIRTQITLNKNMPAGVYFVKITSANNISVIKLIKE